MTARLLPVTDETPGLPLNCRTKLVCRTCQGDQFRAVWNWTPDGMDGGPVLDPRWEIDCAGCGTTWLLDPGGLPNPEEIHGAQVDVSLFQKARDSG